MFLIIGFQRQSKMKVMKLFTVVKGDHLKSGEVTCDSADDSKWLLEQICKKEQNRETFDVPSKRYTSNFTISKDTPTFLVENLPQFEGKHLLEHFRSIAAKQISPYKTFGAL